jgi:hypothetical protein
MRMLPYEATLIPPDAGHPFEWWVSAIGSDGEMYLTAFHHHDAERRARECARATFARVDPELGHRPRAATRGALRHAA